MLRYSFGLMDQPLRVISLSKRIYDYFSTIEKPKEKARNPKLISGSKALISSTEREGSTN
jgi:hypothetical protein